MPTPASFPSEFNLPNIRCGKSWDANIYVSGTLKNTDFGDDYRTKMPALMSRGEVQAPSGWTKTAPIERVADVVDNTAGNIDGLLSSMQEHYSTKQVASITWLVDRAKALIDKAFAVWDQQPLIDDPAAADKMAARESEVVRLETEALEHIRCAQYAVTRILMHAAALSAYRKQLPQSTFALVTEKDFSMDWGEPSTGPDDKGDDVSAGKDSSKLPILVGLAALGALVLALKKKK